MRWLPWADYEFTTLTSSAPIKDIYGHLSPSLRSFGKGRRKCRRSGGRCWTMTSSFMTCVKDYLKHKATLSYTTKITTAVSPIRLASGHSSNSFTTLQAVIAGGASRQSVSLELWPIQHSWCPACGKVLPTLASVVRNQPTRDQWQLLVQWEGMAPCNVAWEDAKDYLSIVKTSCL